MHLLLLTALLLDPAVPVVKKLARPDGVKLTYDVRGTGETTLVFVHGWASERSAFREQASYFAAMNQVVTLDLAAHGESSAGKRRTWTLGALADDVRAVVQKLKSKRVVLVGHSMGGPISLMAAAGMPNCAAVILVDSLHNADGKLSPEEAARFSGRFERDFAGTMTRSIAGMFPPGSPLAAEVTTRALKGNPAILVALIRDYPRLDPPAMFRAVRVPIRAINAAPRSADDPATNLAVNRKYADFDATVLQGPGHYLMLERPGEFNAILREWLSVLK